jgi:glyoxylase-like metal-dependent hydrolase (beta-lactamase superfamily II)
LAANPGFLERHVEEMALDPNINAVADGVYQITLTPPLDGFTDFISAWWVSGPPSFLVDVGPGSTADQLLRALDTLRISHVDYILLTHLHLDHAGAAGRISRRFPGARIICHEQGIPHLIDPAQLWEGTRKVLGPVAAGYGPMEPMPAERLIAAQGFSAGGIAAIATPGHAPHHVSYFTACGLFAGEAAGVCYRLGEGREYLRPATPPRFFLDVSLASIDRLIAHSPGRMLIGHFGLTEDGTGLLQRHRDQLLFWEKWLSREAGRYPPAEAVGCCTERLLAEDPRLASFQVFPQAAQKRERYFLKNSVSGFLGWLQNSEGGRPKAE